MKILDYRMAQVEDSPVCSQCSDPDGPTRQNQPMMLTVLFLQGSKYHTQHVVWVCPYCGCAQQPASYDWGGNVVYCAPLSMVHMLDANELIHKIEDSLGKRA